MVAFADIQAVGVNIGREFRPQRVILFGSHAYGAPRVDSDVDLLVILPFAGKPLHMSLEILNRVDPPFPVDLIARRPDDVERRYRECDLLIVEALERGNRSVARDG